MLLSIVKFNDVYKCNYLQLQTFWKYQFRIASDGVLKSKQDWTLRKSSKKFLHPRLEPNADKELVAERREPSDFSPPVIHRTARAVPLLLPILKHR